MTYASTQRNVFVKFVWIVSVSVRGVLPWNIVRPTVTIQHGTEINMSRLGIQRFVSDEGPTKVMFVFVCPSVCPCLPASGSNVNVSRNAVDIFSADIRHTMRLGLHRISASASVKPKFGHFSQIWLRPNFWPNLADTNATAVRSVSYLMTDKN